MPFFFSKTCSQLGELGTGLVKKKASFTLHFFESRDAVMCCNGLFSKRIKARLVLINVPCMSQAERLVESTHCLPVIKIKPGLQGGIDNEHG